MNRRAKPYRMTDSAGSSYGAVWSRDADRPLRELAVEVLASDVRLFLYALRLRDRRAQ